MIEENSSPLTHFGDALAALGDQKLAGVVLLARRTDTTQPTVLCTTSPDPKVIFELIDACDAAKNALLAGLRKLQVSMKSEEAPVGEPAPVEETPV